MKTAILFFISLLLTSAVSYGQTIPNAGFENWSFIGGQYFTPDGWITNATDVPNRVDMGIPGQSGNYALRLRSNGFAQTKFYSTDYPFTLGAYVKSAIVPGDSVSIQVFIYSANNIAETVKWTNTSSIPNWTHISISSSNSLVTAPDSVEILVKSSNLWETILYVDNFSISPVTGMEDARNSNVSVFPNPFTELISINTNSSELLHFTLYDVTGKVVLDQGNVQNTKTQVQHLPQGIYFYELRNKGVVDRGKLIKN